jgi:hypothetical protein
MAFEEIKENVEEIQEQTQHMKINLAYYIATFKMAMKSTTTILSFL